MTTVTIKDVALALKEDDKARARQLVKTLLQKEPSADAWFLAANAMEDNQQVIKCLKKALELDPWHVKADRMLLKIEGTPKDDVETERQRQMDEINASTGMRNVMEIKRQGKQLEYQQRAIRRKRLNRGLVIGFFILSTVCSTVTMSLVGVIRGPLAWLIQLGGGPSPITELEGIAIEDVPNAAATIEPARRVEASAQDVNVLEHGYVHEYVFEARNGEEVVGYVQFMSISASDVGANVLIINPDDEIVGNDVCQFLGASGIIGGEGNVTFTCNINRNGVWRIRMLGINGESVGAYFAGVETLNP